MSEPLDKLGKNKTNITINENDIDTNIIKNIKKKKRKEIWQKNGQTG